MDGWMMTKSRDTMRILGQVLLCSEQLKRLWHAIWLDMGTKSFISRIKLTRTTKKLWNLMKLMMSWLQLKPTDLRLVVCRSVWLQTPTLEEWRQSWSPEGRHLWKKAKDLMWRQQVDFEIPQWDRSTNNLQQHTVCVCACVCARATQTCKTHTHIFSHPTDPLQTFWGKIELSELVPARRHIHPRI